MKGDGRPSRGRGAGALQHYSGDAQTYITFFTYLDRPAGYADDRELGHRQLCAGGCVGKKDYGKLVEAVHKKMLAAGFVKQSFYDLYEEELKIYHKAMRFLKGGLG